MRCQIIRKTAQLLILMILFMTTPIFSQVESNLDVRQILILNAYHHGLSWTDDSTRAEMDGIKDRKSVV